MVPIVLVFVWFQWADIAVDPYYTGHLVCIIYEWDLCNTRFVVDAKPIHMLRRHDVLYNKGLVRCVPRILTILQFWYRYKKEIISLWHLKGEETFIHNQNLLVFLESRVLHNDLSYIVTILYADHVGWYWVAPRNLESENSYINLDWKTSTRW